MNSTNRGILYGMVIGDGSIHKKKQGNCTLQFTHCLKQKDYAEHKAQKVNSILGGKKNLLNQYKNKTPFGEVEYVKYGKSHKYCNQMRRVVYPEGRFRITRKLLDYLNPEGIAYWYMDDGSLAKTLSKDKTYVSSYEMRLYTYCDEETADIILEYFKEVWGIAAKKRYAKRNKSYNIVFNTTQSKKLELLIKDYIVDSMVYKLPSQWTTRAQGTLTKSEDIV